MVLNEKKILVIDDEPDIGRFVCEVAWGLGIKAASCHHPAEFESIFSDVIDAVVLDLVMPERDGIEILRSMASMDSAAGIILISGYDYTVLHSAQKLATERGLNVIGCLTKPIRIVELEHLLAKVTKLIDTNLFDEEEVLFSPQSYELNDAVTSGELQPYFQPQLDMATNAVVGMEALVRWQYPTRGLIGPNTILPLAEESGSMDELSNEMMCQSFQQLHFLQQQGINTKVSINMAPSNFNDLNLPEAIDELIRKYGLLPEQVVLEVTETTLMQELIESLDILTRLRMKGVKLSIDDFGTGYSSMVQLHRIPFSEIKIDRSFVSNALTDPEALAIVKITIMLAHELGMTVIGEGVENKETWDLLGSLGCDVAQGYYKAKPMSADSLIKWLRCRKEMQATIVGTVY